MKSARDHLPSWQGRQLHTATGNTRFPGHYSENGDGIEFQCGDDSSSRRHACSGAALRATAHKGLTRCTQATRLDQQKGELNGLPRTCNSRQKSAGFPTNLIPAEHGPGPARRFTPRSGSWPGCAACRRQCPAHKPCDRPAIAAAPRAGWGSGRCVPPLFCRARGAVGQGKGRLKNLSSIVPSGSLTPLARRQAQQTQSGPHQRQGRYRASI